MRKILKFIGLFFLFLESSFGCALCQISTPSINVEVNISSDKFATIEWKFTKEFTNEVSTQYDRDKDGVLNDLEFKTVEATLIDYLNKNEHLTYLKRYTPNVKAGDKIDFEVVDASFELLDSKFFYRYNLIFDLNLTSENVLSIMFRDLAGYFNFKIETLEANIDKYITNSNINVKIAFLDIVKEGFSREIQSSKESIEENHFIANSKFNSTIDEENSKEQKSQYFNFLEQNLKALKDKIESYLKEIKEQNSFVAIFSLMLFSFIYGVLHALGPGHGKSLVGSYFLLNRKSYSKALFISSLIGIVHTFSALLFTLVVYFIVDIFLSKLLSDVTLYTTKISAIVIIFIAIYLFYQKIPKKQEIKKYSAIEPHSHSCSCPSCNTQTTDLGVIISAGIIPCPGTVTIFIFTISMGLYYIGLLSAIFMSIGMSLIIFLSSSLTIALRNRVESKFSNITKLLEYFSIFFIFMLGVIMFYS